jgi:hypothetical protein
MLWIIKILGLGIWVAIISMAIVAILFRDGTEMDATFVFVAIMDFIVIGIVARAALRMYHNRRG